MGQVGVRIWCRWFVLGVFAVILSACASSNVSTIQGASQEAISNVSVSEIEVAFETPRPYPALKATLEDQLRQAMPVCAKGSNANKMMVYVTKFEDQNVAKSILIGDEIELEGRVELIEAASGTKTGEYFVARSFFWGGFVGAAMMSDAEASLSKSFSESVCENVFGVKLTEKS